MTHPLYLMCEYPITTHIIYLILVLLAVRNSWCWKTMHDVDKFNKVPVDELHLFMLTRFWVWNVEKMKILVKRNFK